MADQIAEQLTNGVLIETADGKQFECKPLTIAQVRKFQQLRDVAQGEDPVASGKALTELVLTFPEAVGQPSLAEHIAPADVFVLLSDFFWCRTGARVRQPNGTAPSTGTASGPT
jgi:hypothetical protein